MGRQLTRPKTECQQARCTRRPTHVIRDAVRGLTVILLVAAFGCGRAAYRNHPPTGGANWVALGDSLTAGTGAREGFDYPAQLGRRLGRTIYNYGVPGDTTADALARLDDVLAADPRVALVCLGGNDSLQRIPPETTFANLDRILERLHAHGTCVVLIGIRSATALDQYHKRFRQLARHHRVLYVPNILDGVLNQRHLMADQIHPNEAGYEFIAARLEHILRAEGVATY